MNLCAQPALVMSSGLCSRGMSKNGVCGGYGASGLVDAVDAVEHGGACFVRLKTIRRGQRAKADVMPEFTSQLVAVQHRVLLPSGGERPKRTVYPIEYKGCRCRAVEGDALEQAVVFFATEKKFTWSLTDLKRTSCQRCQLLSMGGRRWLIGG